MASSFTKTTLEKLRGNIKKERTKTRIQEAESLHSVCYSVLLALPYFDSVQFTAIDTMHNIFLGTAKRTFNVWVEQTILSRSNLFEIEHIARLFHVPANVGRLPSNISSCYDAFTANQWKTWITIYSPVILKDMLPSEHYR